MLRLTTISRRSWLLLAGAVVAAALAGLLAWSLPAALSLDDRAANVARMEESLAAAEQESASARIQTRAAEARAEAIRANAEQLEAGRRSAAKRLSRLRSRARDLARQVGELGG